MWSCGHLRSSCFSIRKIKSFEELEVEKHDKQTEKPVQHDQPEELNTQQAEFLIGRGWGDGLEKVEIMQAIEDASDEVPSKTFYVIYFCWIWREN